jgi:hypothetical protein
MEDEPKKQEKQEETDSGKLPASALVLFCGSGRLSRSSY